MPTTQKQRAPESGTSHANHGRIGRTVPEFGMLWLGLIRRLTDLTSTWLVWKNADSALAGIGDIDSAAAKVEWPVTAAAFRTWASEESLLPVTICRHIPGGLNLIALPGDSALILEMGVKAKKTFRGSTLFAIEDLLPLSQLDPRGFRKLRPGAEGLFKLFLNGMKPGGRVDEAGLASKHVRDLLREDPEGAQRAAVLFGPASGRALAGAMAAAAGGWDRGAMLAVETWALLRGPRDPDVLARRAWFRLRGSQGCPVVRTLLRDHRRLPVDRDSWLREVEREHVLHGR